MKGASECWSIGCRILCAITPLLQYSIPPFAAPRKKLAERPRADHSTLMHLAHLRLRDFRNYARLDADFSPGFHLLLGDNAQGKTNILEALYLLATLRSFRGVGSAQMIR